MNIFSFKNLLISLILSQVALAQPKKITDIIPEFHSNKMDKDRYNDNTKPPSVVKPAETQGKKYEKKTNPIVPKNIDISAPKQIDENNNGDNYKVPNFCYPSINEDDWESGFPSNKQGNKKINQRKAQRQTQRNAEKEERKPTRSKYATNKVKPKSTKTKKSTQTTNLKPDLTDNSIKGKTTGRFNKLDDNYFKPKASKNIRYEVPQSYDDFESQYVQPQEYNQRRNCFDNNDYDNYKRAVNAEKDTSQNYINTQDSSDDWFDHHNNEYKKVSPKSLVDGCITNNKVRAKAKNIDTNFYNNWDI